MLLTVGMVNDKFTDMYGTLVIVVNMQNHCIPPQHLVAAVGGPVPEGSGSSFIMASGHIPAQLGRSWVEVVCHANMEVFDARC